MVDVAWQDNGKVMLRRRGAHAGVPSRRAALMSGAALTTVFLVLGAPGTANAACSIDGTVQTCTGLLGNGVVATAPIETLLINGITGKIWPDNPGINAVDFQSAGPITIISDTGQYSIIAQDADGIYANSTGGAISIDHQGRIVSDGGYGIRTISLGGTSIIVDGDITGTLGGISARNDDGGSALYIDHTGDIVSSGGHGIDALTSSTPLAIYNNGDIDAGGDGISAVATSFDNVYVSQSGDIDAGGRGIFASAAHGTVTVNSSGDFTSVGTGIHLLSSSSSASANHYGDVTSTGGHGIMVEAPDGAANLIGAGTIQAYNDGIFVQSTGLGAPASVTWDGNITSQTGKGVYAYAANNYVNVDTNGDISSYGDSIFAMTSSFSGALVTHSGNLTSADGNGVYAYAAGGPVNVTVTDSVINAAGYGIFAQTKGANGGDGVTVDFNGTIAGSWIGIQAEATAGAVLVTSEGSITAWDHGIWAANTGSQSVTVNQTGGIDANSGHAIYAYTPNGTVTVNATGDLFRSGMTTIYAENKGSASVTVNVTGDIESGDAGITALSAQGLVTVTMRGDIDADGNGIYAENKSSATVTVDSIGDIGAGGSAIFAASSQGIIDVDSVGDLTAGGYGIYAINTGGNVVTVNSTGNIDADNRGIHAQSSTGAVTVVTNGNVTSNSDAIFAQNLGSSTVSITNVGNLWAGNSGDGIYAFSATGQVTINSTGDIDAGSDGIFARNTGNSTVSVTNSGDIWADNGYGIYGYSTTGAVTIGNTGDIWSNDHGIYALNLGNPLVSVTQVGNIYSNASGIRATSTTGAVSVNNTGDIDAGTDGIFTRTEGATAVSVVNRGDIWADSGYGIYGFSAAGTVTIDNVGDIWSGSDGIYAQTLGTTLISITQVGDIDADGYGVFVNSVAGNASVNTIGDITSGNHGIYALTNGDTLIDIDHEGSITSATGYGISATSIANGTIEVSVDGGTVSGALDGIRVTSWGAMDVTVGDDASVAGTTGNAAVRFVNGLGIQLTNYGSIYNTGGVNEFAVVSAQNDTTVDNYGTLSGSVLLGPWSNGFTNYEGALFNMGSTVNIASGNVLSNAGTLSPGGSGNVSTVALTGGLSSGPTGTLLFDVDMDNALADRIDVSDSASLEGDLRLNFVSATGTPDTYTIVTTGSGVTTQSLTLLNPFVLGDVNTVGNDVQLSINGFDFTPSGLGDNAAAIGNSIQGSIEGPGGLNPIATALLNLPTLEEGEAALNQLSPNIYVGDQIGAVQDIDTFSDGMLSCRMASGEHAFGAEGECAWGRFVYSDYDLEGNGDLTGFSSRSMEVMGGVQMAIEDTAWRIGGSLGYRSSDRDGESGSSSEGDSFSAGAVVKYAPGPYLLAAAVSASRGSYDTLRPIDIGGGFTDLLSGETDVTTVSGRLRAAYTMESGAFYLRPMVDASVTHVRTGAFTESGGIASVSSDGFDNTVLALMPALEIGGQVSLGDDMLLRPYLRGGVNVYSGNDYSLTGAFTADGNAATPFTIGTSSDDLLWTVSTGVDILKGDMGTLQIFYEGAFSEVTAINAGGAKLSVNF